MPAYVVLDIEVTDAVAFAKYKELGPPAVAAYGGRYLARGGKVETLEGSWTPSRLVISSSGLRSHGAASDRRCVPGASLVGCVPGPCPGAATRILYAHVETETHPGDGGLMAKPNFVEQVATLNATLSAIEEQLARGEAAVEGLEDFKSALDDVRLRLWGLLSAAGGDDFKGFQERFRIRRATEMSRGLGGDLRTGAVSGRHRELAGLREAANELAQSIEQAQRPAF